MDRYRRAMLMSLCAILTIVVPMCPAATFTCAVGDAACLIAAMHLANRTPEADTIQLAAGTYTLTTVDNNTDGANGLPSITSAVTIQGAGADQTLVERHVNAPQFRLVHVAATGSLTLRGLTIRGGTCFGDCGGGGGVFNQHGTLIIQQTTIAGNRTGVGAGGLVTYGGAVTIADSTIADNIGDVSSHGGGLANFGGQVNMVRSVVIGNSAFHMGGGLYHEGGTMTIRQTTIAGNSADATGGLWIQSGAVTITNSTIADNNGSLSGANGIFNMGDLTITNSTVAHNHGIGSNGGGGALLVNGGTTRIRNSTIAENSLSDQNTAGGGILTLQGTVQLQNTILSRNQVGPFGRGPDCFGPVVSLGHNLIGDPTGCTITLQPTDLAGDPAHGPLDPGLGPFTDTGLPGGGYFPLVSASPAINAGNDAACPPRDQLGHPRAGTCDIGAVEFQPLPALALSLNQTNFRSGETLRISLHAQNPGLAIATDFYFAVILPDSVTTLCITHLSPLDGVWTRLDADARTFQPLVANVQLAQGFDVTFDPLLAYTFSGGETPGTYQLVAALTPAEAFSDGHIDEGDLLALAVEPFRFSPSANSDLIARLLAKVQAIRDRHMNK